MNHPIVLNYRMQINLFLYILNGAIWAFRLFQSFWRRGYTFAGYIGGMQVHKWVKMKIWTDKKALNFRGLSGVGLVKWNHSNEMTEASHHYIDGAQLDPDAAKTLTRAKVSR